MKTNLGNPSPEAKALSLYLMAYKKTSPTNKERSVRINRAWSQVQKGELSMTAYNEKVNSMLRLLGGYEKVVEKTVRFYINKTGEWKLKGDDQYCKDAKQIADGMLNK